MDDNDFFLHHIEENLIGKLSFVEIIAEDEGYSFFGHDDVSTDELLRYEKTVLEQVALVRKAITKKLEEQENGTIRLRCEG